MIFNGSWKCRVLTIAAQSLSAASLLCSLCSIPSCNLGLGQPLQHTWDNAGRNKPCICFSFQERALFVCLSCELGLFAECLKTFRRGLSPPKPTVIKQLLNLISARRASYLLLYYTSKMDAKQMLKGHRWNRGKVFSNCLKN